MKNDQPAWITVLLYWFGATYALNGIAMFFFPSAWFFRLVPGVPETGAFNAHLVMDGGTFYIPIGIALIVAARDAKRHVSAVAIAAGATVLHALLHLYSHEAGLLSWDHVATELVGIYLPATLLTAIALLAIVKPIPALAGAQLSPKDRGKASAY
jgi:hypothetical protein